MKIFFVVLALAVIQQASACCGCGGSCGCKSKKPSLEINYESCGCGSYQPSYGSCGCGSYQPSYESCGYGCGSYQTAPITASVIPYPAPNPCYSSAPAYAAPTYSAAPVTAIVQEYDYAAYNPCYTSSPVSAPASYSAPLSYTSPVLDYAAYGCGCSAAAAPLAASILEYSAPAISYSAPVCAPASLPLSAPVLPYPAPALPALPASCGCAPPALFPFKGCVPATICF